MDPNAAAAPVPPAPAEEPTPAPPPAPPAPPTAARIVATAQRTERELALETELEAERVRHSTTAAEKKSHEMRIAELEDQNFQLKRVAPTPRPAKRQSQPLTVWEHFEQEN